MGKLLSDSILDLGKFPDQKTHESESACFLVRALPEVQNQIQKQFSHKVFYNYITKQFFLVFRSIFEKVFSNLAQKGSRVFFQARKQICWPNGFYLPNKQLWIGEKVQF